MIILLFNPGILVKNLLMKKVTIFLQESFGLTQCLKFGLIIGHFNANKLLINPSAYFFVSYDRIFYFFYDTFCLTLYFLKKPVLQEV